MRRVIRTWRWQPVFITVGARRRIFFYSEIKRAGTEAFFHQHHDDARPHLHLSERAHALHQHREQHQHREPPDSSHRVESHTHWQVGNRHCEKPTADQRGHWHFSLAGAERLLPNLLQFIALQYAAIWTGSQDHLIATVLVVDHWARPPPR